MVFEAILANVLEIMRSASIEATKNYTWTAVLTVVNELNDSFKTDGSRVH